MKYFYEIITDFTKYTISITNNVTGDSVVIQNHDTSNGWLLKQILPANGVYTISFVDPSTFDIHTYVGDKITSTLQCKTDGSVRYYPKDYFGQAKPEPEKEQIASVIDNKTSIYYESRLMMDTVIRKLLTGHTKESIVADDGVTMEFLNDVEEILVIINMHSTDYANVDKLALLKDVVKNYVEHRCGKYIRSIYFREEHTVDEVLKMVDVPIEEFRGSIGMLTLYRELFGEFVE